MNSARERAREGIKSIEMSGHGQQLRAARLKAAGSGDETQHRFGGCLDRAKLRLRTTRPFTDRRNSKST